MIPWDSWIQQNLMAPIFQACLNQRVICEISWFDESGNFIFKPLNFPKNFSLSCDSCKYLCRWLKGRTYSFLLVNSKLGLFGCFLETKMKTDLNHPWDVLHSFFCYSTVLKGNGILKSATETLRLPFYSNWCHKIRHPHRQKQVNFPSVPTYFS